MLDVLTGLARDAGTLALSHFGKLSAAYPILLALGAASTLVWSNTPLDAKLRFAIGKPRLLDALASLERPA